MTLSTKLWRCALLDAKTYAEVADDQGATRMAGWIALWAAASCGVGLFGFNIFGVLECILFAGVCLVVTTYIAFAQSPDQGSRTLQGRHQARRRRRAQGPDHPLAILRMIGFAAAPGLLGLLGVLWRTFAWLAVVWWVVAFGYALMRGFKYRRAGTVIRIGGVSMVLCGLILAAYRAVFDSFGGLLMFLLVVAVLIFHRAILDWMVRHSRTVKTAVRGDAPTPLQEAQDLFRRKGWDMTLRDLAGPFLMIPFPLIPEESLAPEPDSKAAPPEPTLPANPEPDRTEATSPEPVVVATTTEGDEQVREAGEQDRTHVETTSADTESPSPAPEPTLSTDPEPDRAEATTPEVSETGKEPSVTIQVVCEACFGDNALDYESERTFAERFSGRAIRWRGVLKSVETFSYDHVFGNERGFRAILDIYEISERFGKRPVQAVVLMSPEQAEEWKTDLNVEREFTGVLTALKPYSRKLYVKRPSSEPAK